MITAALAQLESLADPDRAAEAAAYHKAPRRYLGIPVPQVEALVADWRAQATLDARTTLAAALWETDIHEARVAAAKLLTQARITPDAEIWALLCQWAETFDAWAVADHATTAAQKRLMADPTRITTVEGWTTHPNMWTRRAALVITLPYAKMSNPKAGDIAIRKTALRWAEAYITDRDWFIQKAIAGWLRDLSKHDPARTRAFLDAHGQNLKSFARKEAARHLDPAGTGEVSANGTHNIS